MFTTILIANRGEIACRIIATAKQMGITTIAIYSHIDHNSLHVKMADIAYCIGNNIVTASYLNIEAIINTAVLSKAEAIHPGYGFLSENPEFAQACNNAGIVFIGPSIAAMEAMASKQLAKQLLSTTKIPLTPGYHDHEQNDQHLFIEAQKIGFPLLLKAASGGGGKGMRVVTTKDEFFTEIDSARREAQSYFGNNIIIMEKLLLNPRHIEVQILADNYGNTLHCFERDCSLQRRHQKIIEEAPAGNIEPHIRQQLTQTACDVATAINYTGAGTVEFLLDQDNNFYFMEMNTRLQVEHPVTEMITKLDLVEWQIKIAANERLTITQEDVIPYGHAIECRIYAEDPEQNFLPSVGTIEYLSSPQDPNIRIDTGIEQNSNITMYYDPMIAKLIVFGSNREVALQTLNTALQNYIIIGVKTNIAFLQAVCKHPEFVNNQITTDFLAKEPIILERPPIHHVLFFATAFDYYKLQEGTDWLWQKTFAWQAAVTSYWYWNYRIHDQDYKIKIQPINLSQFIIIIDNKEYNLTIIKSNELITINYVDTQQLRSQVFEYNNKIYCHFTSGVMTVQRWKQQHSVTTTNINDELTAPMSATVVAILRSKGDQVQSGDSLIVLEAMKMEYTIYAHTHGIVSDIYYNVGDQVIEGAELLTVIAS